jgi:hypothetical protein
VPFVDTNELKDDSTPLCRKTAFKVTENTFDGCWSSNEYEDDSFEEKRLRKRKKIVRHNFWKHKSKSLAGKIACKFCDTFFESKEDKISHSCEYLQCDPKNFICRICNKELSKNTFSNHLHETLDCQYCGKKFVNPRNMKAHIKKQHRGYKFVQPERKIEDKQETQPFKQRPKYQKKKERFECGKKLSQNLFKLGSSNFNHFRYLWEISRVS